MAVISSGNHPKDKWPGVHKWWGRKYGEYPKEWAEIFGEEKSEKAYEEDVEVTGFGLAPVKAEAAAVQYDSEQQGLVARYTHVVYSLGYIVTEEEQDDSQYEVVSRRRSEALAFSVRQTEEIVAANVLNRAFNSSYSPQNDGAALGSTSHPSLNGNQSNILATAADLSEASLEDLMVQIALATNSRGLRIAIKPMKLIVPPQLIFTAERLVKTSQRVGTANNDVNAMKSAGMLSGGYCVNHYLTDSDAFFIKTDAPRGLTRFTRKGVSFTQDNDFDTSNAKAKSSVRFSVGCTDWRGIYGTAGA